MSTPHTSYCFHLSESHDIWVLLLVCVPLDYSTICQSICNDQTILSIRVPGMVVDAYSRVSRRREKKRDTVNLVSQCSTLYSYLLLGVLVTCTSYTCTCTIVVVVVVAFTNKLLWSRWSRMLVAKPLEGLCVAFSMISTERVSLFDILLEQNRSGIRDLFRKLMPSHHSKEVIIQQ